MKIFSIRNIIPCILILIALVPLTAFFQVGLPQGHDAQDHVVRIANFYKGLTEGIIFPRWGANLNWGYGHPVMSFLYPFSSYVASLFHFIGFSLVDATKAVFVIAYIGSILSMYLWMNSAWGKRVGVIGALLYAFAPYRFVDIYVRMAIGEHMAFVFPPLICYFLYKIAIQNKKSYGLNSLFSFLTVGLSISTAGLILSHNAITLMFIPIIGLYALYLWIFEVKHRIIFLLPIIMGIMLGFGLASFFVVPAFFEGKYTLRNIITAGEALYRFVPYYAFFYSPWNYGGGETITKEIGYVQWFGILMSFITFLKVKESKMRILLIGLWLIFLLSLFIMTPASWYIWKQIMILQNFQFPLRFLSVSVFISACIGGLSLSYFVRSIHIKNSINIIFGLMILIIIFSTYYMWHPKSYQIEPESFYTRIYPGTTDTGESTPIWTTRFQEQYPKAPIEVISGIATVKEKKRTTTIHEYTVQAETRSELLENTIYFPGWEVYIDGKKTPIEFQSEIHRGIISFWVEKGDHTVRIEFGDTKLRTISNTITIVSSVILFIICLYTIFLWKRKK